MATPFDAARPTMAYNSQNTFTAGAPTVGDWNGQFDNIYVAFNTAMDSYNAHASRHGPVGADPLNVVSLTAARESFAYYLGG